MRYRVGTGWTENLTESSLLTAIRGTDLMQEGFVVFATEKTAQRIKEILKEADFKLHAVDIGEGLFDGVQIIRGY